ncbi:Hsp70 family protein [Pedobacter sp. SYSU D00535]|uniref:Hsp70 family protein n=1 Tax=Pedobacter sp. SYSU D00535 TaxID=2810308 RepID=UPI001A969CE4|nr:Hsp70 family protein [Pedobacter sp. SYSU D00535]
MSNFLYGLDFGTTNSVLCIYDEDKEAIIETIRVPSLIYFPAHSFSGSDDPVIGEKAISAYLEEEMQGRFIKSVKQILSRPSFTETRINGRRYNASDLVALILKDLKRKADAITGVDCRKAVVGRPVFFDDDNAAKDSLAQTRLSKAVAMAGFSDVRFQFEPIGAAFAYERTIKKREKVLVADLGGGTTDFTFLELDPKKAGSTDRRNDMIASGGIYIGGDSFDSSFMWTKGTPYFGKDTLYEATPGKLLKVPMSLFENICTWDKMNFFNSLKIRRSMEEYYHYSKNDRKFRNLLTLVDHNLGYAVFKSIEKTKIGLSEADTFPFQYSNMGIEIDEKITLDDYNKVVQKDIAKISSYLDQFLKTYNIATAEIDSLFLTGGSSMVKAVQTLFQTKFPDCTIHTGDNFISVAEGLAYSGYLFKE